MLKIFQPRLQQYVNQELPDIQAVFRKGRGIKYQFANIWWIIEKARELQKNIYFCFMEYSKIFDCVDHNKLWKILQEMEYQTTLPASWEIWMQVKKQQIELVMEQRTGSKLGNKYVKAVYCHPAYLTYAGYIMWNAGLNEVQVGIKIARRNINNFRYADDTTHMAESEEKLNSLLMKMKEESGKSWLKTQHSKNLRSWHLVPTLHGNAGETMHQETMETVIDFIFLGSKITADGEIMIAAMKLKDACSLEEKL